MRVEWTSRASPLGPLILVECAAGPLVVEFAPRAGRIGWLQRLRARMGEVEIELGPCQITSDWLRDYFGGLPRPFAFPQYLPDYLPCPEQALTVWRSLCSIPFGETRAYEDIAHLSGLNPRQVGQLVGSNQLAILIPCHRVVGKDGGLVGYGGGLVKKRWLLDHELRTAGVVLR